MIKELDARHDSRKSFYGKAYIEEKKGEKVLFSYHTKVARKKADKVTLGQSYDYSSTTLRHVKEFLNQETNFFYWRCERHSQTYQEWRYKIVFKVLKLK